MQSTLLLKQFLQKGISSPFLSSYVRCSSCCKRYCAILMRFVRRKSLLAPATLFLVIAFLPFSALAYGPDVKTYEIEKVSSTCAVLRGWTDSRGTAGTVRWFEWGNKEFHSAYATRWYTMVGAGDFESVVTTLDPDTDYFFRAVAENSFGRIYGNEVSFHTFTRAEQSSVVSECKDGSLYTVSTNAPVIMPGNPQTTSSVSIKTIPTAHTEAIPVTNPKTESTGASVVKPVLVSNLVQPSLYTVPQSAATLNVSNITDTGVTLNSVIFPSLGIKTYGWFEWGKTRDLGFGSGAILLKDISAVSMSKNISGLSQGTTYYFRPAIRSTYGTSYGLVYSFRTPSPKGLIVETVTSVKKTTPVVQYLPPSKVPAARPVAQVVSANAIAQEEKYKEKIAAFQKEMQKTISLAETTQEKIQTAREIMNTPEFAPESASVSVSGSIFSRALDPKAALLAERQLFNARISADVFLDTDQDGISNYDETNIYGTSPEDSDTNKDGISDGDSLFVGIDPVKKNTVPIMYEDPRAVKTALAAPIDVFNIKKVETITIVGDRTQTILVSFKGIGPKNAYVALYIFSSPVVVVVRTDSEGNWEYTMDREITDGSHEIYLAMTDSGGKILVNSLPIPFVKTANAITFGLSENDAASPAGFFSWNTLWFFVAIISGVIVMSFITISLILKRKGPEEINFKS